MTLTQLQILQTVLEKGGFTAAAEHLTMTQSAVSHALANLESELGVALVERERGNLRLTASGEKIMPHVRELLFRAESIRQEAAAAKGLACGKLRVGTFRSTSARLLPGIIRECRQRYPGLEIVLFEGNDGEIYRWIKDRVVEVGFVTQLVSDLPVVSLTRDEFVALLPARHPLARYSQVSVQQLAAAPFILSSGGCEGLILQIFEAENINLHPQFEVSDVPTVIAMVQEGLGVTVVPRLTLPELLPPVSEAKIEVRSLTRPAYRQLGLGLRSLENISPLVRYFIEETQNWLKAHDFEPD